MPATALIPALADAILNAQLLAVRALTKLLETADDPRELRRIAAALLKLRPPAPEQPAPASPTHAPATPAPTAPLHHATPEPLLPTELADLRILFPDIRADHFTRTHSPAYWRGIIHRHAAIPASAQRPSTSPEHASAASP